jgi:hypothetical protein
VTGRGSNGILEKRSGSFLAAMHSPMPPDDLDIGTIDLVLTKARPRKEIASYIRKTYEKYNPIASSSILQDRAPTCCR